MKTFIVTIFVLCATTAFAHHGHHHSHESDSDENDIGHHGHGHGHSHGHGHGPHGHGHGHSHGHGHNHGHTHGPATFVLVGTSGTKQFYTAHVHTNWLEANEFCQVNYMTLATFETPAELALVAESLSNSTISHETESETYDHEFFWTSGHDFGHEGTFNWLPNNALVAQAGLVTNFNAYDLESNCVQIHYINGGYLYDTSCEDKHDDLPLCEDKSGINRVGTLATVPVWHGHHH